MVIQGLEVMKIKKLKPTPAQIKMADDLGFGGSGIGKSEEKPENLALGLGPKS